MKIRTLIVDDEPDAREALTLTINNYCLNDIEIIGEVATIKQAVQTINKENPDLVLLDVDLINETGFDLFDYFREDYPFKVVFTTAYKEYAIKAFKYAALDYILKPVAPEELQKVIFRYQRDEKYIHELKVKTFLSNHENELEINKKLVLPKPDGYDVVNISDIIYCEGEVNYTKIHSTIGKQHLVSFSLKKMEELLPKEIFHRIHKSHIINMNYIDSIDRKRCEVILSNNKKLPIASRRIGQFIETLNS